MSVHDPYLLWRTASVTSHLSCLIHWQHMAAVQRHLCTSQEGWSEDIVSLRLFLQFLKKRPLYQGSYNNSIDQPAISHSVCSDTPSPQNLAANLNIDRTHSSQMKTRLTGPARVLQCFACFRPQTKALLSHLSDEITPVSVAQWGDCRESGQHRRQGPMYPRCLGGTSGGKESCC